MGESNRILIRFEGVHGSPLISGICIKEAPKLPGDLNKLSRLKEECPFCHSSTAQMELTTSQVTLVKIKDFKGLLICLLNCSKLIRLAE